MQTLPGDSPVGIGLALRTLRFTLEVRVRETLLTGFPIAAFCLGGALVSKGFCNQVPQTMLNAEIYFLLFWRTGSSSSRSQGALLLRVFLGFYSDSLPLCMAIPCLLIATGGMLPKSPPPYGLA